MFGDSKQYERIANKIIDLFADHRLPISEVQFVALYVTYLAGSQEILDKLQEFSVQLDKHRGRMEEDARYKQDALF